MATVVLRLRTPWPSSAEAALPAPGPPCHDCVISLPWMSDPTPRRPAWLNWLILLAFLWSSWQLAGFWVSRLHG